jgi:hypothetical protein
MKFEQYSKKFCKLVVNKLKDENFILKNSIHFLGEFQKAQFDDL